MRLQLSKMALAIGCLSSSSIAAPQHVTTLPEVVKAAVEKNPQVKLAQANEAQAIARVKQFRSRFAPTLSLAASSGDNHEIEFGREFSRKVSQSSVALSWNLFRGGSDTIELKAANLELDASRIDIEKAKEEVASRAANAWFELVKQSLWEDLAERKYSRIHDLNEKLKLQFQVGKISEIDKLLGDNSLLNVQSELITTRSSRASAQLQLEILSGVKIGEAKFFEFSDREIDPAYCIDHNRALIVSTMRAGAARARVINFLTAHLPSLDFTLRRILNNYASPALTTVTDRSWSAGVTWQIPLGGENNYIRQQTIARADAAEQEQNLNREKAQLELTGQLEALHSTKQSLAMLREQFEHTQKITESAQLLFDAGRRNLQQYIQMIETENETAKRYAQERVRYQQIQQQVAVLCGDLIEQLQPVTFKATELASSDLNPTKPSTRSVEVSSAQQTNRVSTNPSTKQAESLSTTLNAALSESSTITPPVSTNEKLPDVSAFIALSKSSEKSTSPTSIQSQQANQGIEAKNQGVVVEKDVDNINERMQKWKNAWETNDIHAYLDFYASEFPNRKAWVKQRTQRLKANKNIRLEFSEIEWDKNLLNTNGIVVMRFKQSYQSKSFNDVVTKKIVWRRDGEIWKILVEDVLK